MRILATEAGLAGIEKVAFPINPLLGGFSPPDLEGPSPGIKAAAQPKAVDFGCMIPPPPMLKKSPLSGSRHCRGGGGG